MRPHAATLAPIVAFVALLLLAVTDVRLASGRPHAQVHGLARAYGEALAAGDPGAAAGFHRDFDAEALAGLSSALRGAVFWIEAVRDEPGGVVTTLIWDQAAPAGEGKPASSRLSVQWVQAGNGWQIVP